MKKYYYLDCFVHSSDGLTATEIKADEKAHGKLLYMKHKTNVIPCFYSVNEDKELWHKK